MVALAGFLWGSELHQFTSSMQPSDYPYRQRTFTAIHGCGSKRGSTGIRMSATTTKGRAITARALGRLAAPVSGIRTPECLPGPGTAYAKGYVEGLPASPADSRIRTFRTLFIEVAKPLQHAPTKTRQSPKLWRVFMPGVALDHPFAIRALRRHEAVETRLCKAEPEDLIALELRKSA